VAGGIFAGFFLLAIEIAFKRRKEKQDKEIELSRTALIHWRKSIEVNKLTLNSLVLSNHS
jgi:ionotropic glutamate receptor NMDA 1